MSQEVMRPYEAIPALAYEWQQDPTTTVDKFRAFIRYHESRKEDFQALLHRCALVQLMNGHPADVLHGYNYTPERLKQEAGA